MHVPVPKYLFKIEQILKSAFSYTGGTKLIRRCSMTNERQVALRVMENLKEETVPVRAPSRESAIDAPDQKEWLERKLQELRQEAGV
jgi:hypothetical protein